MCKNCTRFLEVIYLVNKYSILDCFAGIGGFSLGFSNSGFNIVAAIEENKKACSIYQKNFPYSKIINADMNSVNIDEIPDCDVIIGRIPISSFSKAGMKRNVENELYIDKLFDIISTKMPRAFVFEASIHINKNENFEQYIKKISEIGYLVKWSTLKSEELTGNSLKEKRFYIIGILNEFEKFDIIVPKSVEKYSFTEIMQAEKDIDERCYKIKISERNVIINPDVDSVTCNYMNITCVKDKRGVRRVTVREYARLKGFPDDYIIDDRNLSEAYKLVFQATNVTVAKFFAILLNEILFEKLEQELVNYKDKVLDFQGDTDNKRAVKDLTNSRIDRQNILNNELAIEEIQEKSGLDGINWDGKLVMTREITAKFFNVDIRTVSRYIEQYKEELTENGYEILRGKRLKTFLDQAKNSGKDINVSTKTTVLGVFDFRSFLNLAMLLSESEQARILRQIMLDIVIDLINRKTGGGTKYINQRDKNFVFSSLQEENYRRQFTDALKLYVEEDKYKYAHFTDLIYVSIFKEKAKEYKKILELKASEKVRDTFYTEILDIIAAYESGLADAIKQECERCGHVLSRQEVESLFKSFENMALWKPLIQRGRVKMASRDMALRDAFHYQLAEYIQPLNKEEYQKFLGTAGDELDQLMKENQDILKRLKERE